MHDASPHPASSLQTGATPLAASALLHELVRLVQCGPTSMNSQPLRVQFLVSDAAKERLVACLNAGNVAKTRSAPVVAILGMDLDIPERLPRLGFEDIARIV